MLTAADLVYIRANFIALEELCARREISLDSVRELIERRGLPRASYLLDDGTEMVPPDYFALYDAAGGKDPEQLFRRRFAARAQELGLDSSDIDPGEDWSGYLSGDFNVCLQEQTPETSARRAFT